MKSVFHLTGLYYLYSYGKERSDAEEGRIWSQDISLGHFSTYDKAIERLKDQIKKDKYEMPEEDDELDYGDPKWSVLGYSIREIMLDLPMQTHEYHRITAFNPDGKVIEVKINDCDLPDLPRFDGRSYKDTYFRLGDIAVDIDGRMCIVVGTPYSKVWAHFNDEPLDDGDDYYCVYYLDKGDTHAHIPAAGLYPVPFELNEEQRKPFIDKMLENHLGWMLYDGFALSRLSAKETGLKYDIQIATRSQPTDDTPMLLVDVTIPDSDECEQIAVLLDEAEPHFRCPTYVIHLEDRKQITDWINLNHETLLAHWRGETSSDQAINQLKDCHGNKL